MSEDCLPFLSHIHEELELHSLTGDKVSYLKAKAKARCVQSLEHSFWLPAHLWSSSLEK